MLISDPAVPKNLTRAEAILIPAVPAVPVKPSLAYACLKSMPLDRDIALHQVQTLRPYWEWQSTIDYTRVPPKGYLSEGVDIFKGLDDISAKLRTNSTPYTSFFDFLTDLHILQGRARDFHFLSLPVLLDLFTFVPSVKFVSISKDGQALPEIFLYGVSNLIRLLFNLLTRMQKTTSTSKAGTNHLQCRPLTIHRRWSFCRSSPSMTLAPMTQTPDSTAFSHLYQARQTSSQLR